MHGFFALDRGGTTGSIRELSGQLIITQTPENMSQVEALLHSLRQGTGVVLNVETRFISVDTGRWWPELQAILQPALDKSAPFTLTTAKYRDLMQAVRSTKAAELLTAPRITLFNGQHASVSVGSQTSYISGFTPVKSPNGDMRYEPQSSNLSEGITLDVTATASADRQSVTLAFHPKLSKLLEMRSEPWPDADDAKQLRIQKPVLYVQDVYTTVTIPADRIAVVAASPARGKSGSATRPADTRHRLFILVKASVVNPEKKK